MILDSLGIRLGPGDPSRLLFLGVDQDGLNTEPGSHQNLPPSPVCPVQADLPFFSLNAEDDPGKLRNVEVVAMF